MVLQIENHPQKCFNFVWKFFEAPCTKNNPDCLKFLHGFNLITFHNCKINHVAKGDFGDVFHEHD